METSKVLTSAGGIYLNVRLNAGLNARPSVDSFDYNGNTRSASGPGFSMVVMLLLRKNNHEQINMVSSSRTVVVENIPATR